MLSPVESQKALQKLFHKQEVAELGDLFQALDTRSRMSVFRRLKGQGYLSSFTHAGSHYTLQGVPSFDEWGLWFHHDIGFSRAGTLKDTVLELVESSVEGMTPKELLILLRLPAGNTLYNTLHELRQTDRLRRQRIKGCSLYLSGNPIRAEKQLAQWQHESSREVAPPQQVSTETVIVVLVEALQAGLVLAAPSLVASRLALRGMAVTTAQVEGIFADYGLEAGKKTVEPGSTPSKNSED